jgi:hypothetical protein
LYEDAPKVPIPFADELFSLAAQGAAQTVCVVARKAPAPEFVAALADADTKAVGPPR